MDEKTALKIGVFDSGVGGITVLSELKNRFKHAHFVYLGDTANVPYGPKSSNQIRALCKNAAGILKTHSVDMVVVACNTASSLALEDIQSVMGRIPVVGVVEPGVKAVFEKCSNSSNTPVLVLATRATVKSEAYLNRLRIKLPEAEIYQQACPLLVPMIEEGWVDHPILHATIQEYVSTYRKMNPGFALLGCTHYPWIQDAFQKALPSWTIINSASAVADECGRLGLTWPNLGLLKVDWVFTDPDSVPAFAKQFILNLNT